MSPGEMMGLGFFLAALFTVGASILVFISMKQNRKIKKDEIAKFKLK